MSQKPQNARRPTHRPQTMVRVLSSSLVSEDQERLRSSAFPPETRGPTF